MASTTTIQQLPYPDPGDTVDVPRDVRALAEKMDPLGFAPVGAMMMWPGAVAPTGWLLMQGQTNIPAANYPILAGLLGQTGANLKMPDMQDRFPIGASSGAPLGQPGGANTVPLVQANLPAHTHPLNGTANTAGNHGHTLNITSSDVVDPSHRFAVAGGITYGTLLNQAGGSNLTVPHSTADNWHGESGSHVHGGSTAVAGGDHTHTVTGTAATDPALTGTAHENRPQFFAVNYIIKAG